MGKAVVAAISLILVVGAVIGAVVIVKQHNNKNGSTASTSGSSIVTGMKAVDTLCAPAYHPDLCKETLTPVIKGDVNASPKAFLEASFQEILKAVNQALEDSKSLDKVVKDKFDASSMEVCKRYIGYMAEDLEISISRLSMSDMTNMDVFARDLNIFLSAVLAYKSTCVDEMDNGELKEALQGRVLLNTTKLTENGIIIVQGVAQFLGVNYDEESDEEEEELEGKPNRRLLDVGEDGYPTWLGASERNLLQAQRNPEPDVTVAKDGSERFTKIQDAIDSCPENNERRCVIYVKEGIYTGNITVSRKNITMYGDGPRKTIVTADLNFGLKNIKTSGTATVAVLKHGFWAKSMGFHNTAGPLGHQAVALLTKSEMAIYYDCIFDGYQDTLYYQAHKAFFRNCTIYGTVDFIFGKGKALIQSSDIIAKNYEGNVIYFTADGTEINPGNKTLRENITGLVIQNCKIMGEPSLAANSTIKKYLARPWYNFSTTIIMESNISGMIMPEGYSIWNTTHPFHLTATYREYGNEGAGANTTGRVQWGGSFKKMETQHEAKTYIGKRWLPGIKPWLKEAGIPRDLGFTKTKTKEGVGLRRE